MPPTKSVSRILNVLAVLAERREPIAFGRLCELVPDYRADWEKHLALGAKQDRATSRPFQSLKRKFERDKDMLLRLGIQVHWEERGAGQDKYGRPIFESFLSLSRRNFFSQYSTLQDKKSKDRRRTQEPGGVPKISKPDTALLTEAVTVLAAEIDPALTEAAARAVVKLTRESGLPRPTNGQAIVRAMAAHKSCHPSKAARRAATPEARHIRICVSLSTAAAHLSCGCIWLVLPPWTMVLVRMGS